MHIHRIKTDRTSADKQSSPTDTMHYHSYQGGNTSFSQYGAGHTHKYGDVETGPAQEIDTNSPAGRVAMAKERKTIGMSDTMSADDAEDICRQFGRTLADLE